jgi:hypothetical protein
VKLTAVSVISGQRAAYQLQFPFTLRLSQSFFSEGTAAAKLLFFRGLRKQ